MSKMKRRYEVGNRLSIHYSHDLYHDRESRWMNGKEKNQDQESFDLELLEMHEAHSPHFVLDGGWTPRSLTRQVGGCSPPNSVFFTHTHPRSSTTSDTLSCGDRLLLSWAKGCSVSSRDLQSNRPDWTIRFTLDLLNLGPVRVCVVPTVCAARHLRRGDIV